MEVWSCLCWTGLPGLDGLPGMKGEPCTDSGEGPRGFKGDRGRNGLPGQLVCVLYVRDVFVWGGDVCVCLYVCVCVCLSVCLYNLCVRERE